MVQQNSTAWENNRATPQRTKSTTTESKSSRLEAPVHVAVVGHRFVHEREKFRIVILQSFACVDGMRGIVRRSVLAEGMKISEHAFRPVSRAIVDGGGAFPFTR